MQINLGKLQFFLQRLTKIVASDTFRFPLYHHSHLPHSV